MIRTFISEEIVANVTTNVVHITLILFSLYPVMFIIRSMVNFVAKAFSRIDPSKVLNIPHFTFSGKKKGEIDL